MARPAIIMASAMGFTALALFAGALNLYSRPCGVDQHALLVNLLNVPIAAGIAGLVLAALVTRLFAEKPPRD